MKAALYEAFAAPLKLVEVPDPVPPPMGVVLEVKATGLCRSDWHGWMGHDPDIRLPHVPGHEMSGVIEALGSGVAAFQPGDRVCFDSTVNCNRCEPCGSGQSNRCEQRLVLGVSGPGFMRDGDCA